jgi:hypothetical protein
MKKLNIVYLALFLCSFALFTSCEVEEKTYFQNEALVVDGAYLLTLDYPNNTLSISDIENSLFEVTFEAHDYTSDTSVFQSVDVMVSYSGDPDTEVPLGNIDSASFERNDIGYPEFTYNSAPSEALAALALDLGSVSSGEFLKYRFIINLSDGTSYSEGDIGSATVIELKYESPYFYEASFVN